MKKHQRQMASAIAASGILGAVWLALFLWKLDLFSAYGTLYWAAGPILWSAPVLRAMFRTLDPDNQ